MITIQSSSKLLFLGINIFTEVLFFTFSDSTVLTCTTLACLEGTLVSLSNFTSISGLLAYASFSASSVIEVVCCDWALGDSVVAVDGECCYV